MSVFRCWMTVLLLSLSASSTTTRCCSSVIFFSFACTATLAISLPFSIPWVRSSYLLRRATKDLSVPGDNEERMGDRMDRASRASDEGSSARSAGCWLTKCFASSEGGKSCRRRWAGVVRGESRPVAAGLTEVEGVPHKSSSSSHVAVLVMSEVSRWERLLGEACSDVFAIFRGDSSSPSSCC